MSNRTISDDSRRKFLDARVSVQSGFFPRAAYRYKRVLQNGVQMYVCLNDRVVMMRLFVWSVDVLEDPHRKSKFPK